MWTVFPEAILGLILLADISGPDPFGPVGVTSK
jgi:hypothetical protein